MNKKQIFDRLLYLFLLKVLIDRPEFYYRLIMILRQLSDLILLNKKCKISKISKFYVKSKSFSTFA
jgi:hypothetical protein